MCSQHSTIASSTARSVVRACSSSITPSKVIVGVNARASTTAAIPTGLATRRSSSARPPLRSAITSSLPTPRTTSPAIAAGSPTRTSPPSRPCTTGGKTGRSSQRAS